MIEIIEAKPYLSAAKKKQFRMIMKRCAGEIGLRGDFSIRLAGDEEMRAANLKFRGKDNTTDVLSFCMNEKMPRGYYAGDILISVDQAKKQSVSSGWSLEKELVLLMIHGLLHLSGFDHQTDDGEMMRRQEHLVSSYFEEMP